MLMLVCVSSYLKSVLRHKSSIFGTYHVVTVYLMNKDMRIRGYFSKPKGVREQKSMGYYGIDRIEECVSFEPSRRPNVT
jgi:hypothetical protein